MTTTRKTQKKAEELRISQVGDFKKRIGGIQEMPSGLVVKYRNPGGLSAFMANGTIPNSLMPIVKKSLEVGKAPDPKEFMSKKNGDIDPTIFAEMGEMFDSVAMSCIIEPKLHPKPTNKDVAAWNKENPNDMVEDPEDLRSDEKLYVDEIPLDDKQFLMQLITGGVKDLETFRERQEQGLASVAQSQNDVRNAQRAAGLDPR